MPKDCTEFEKQLIEHCRKGNRKYQEMLYKHYYGFALSICWRYSNSKDDAVSIVNDSFLKVFDKIKEYDLNQTFKGWLRRILVNSAIDYFRRNAKHQHHSDLEVAENEPDGVTEDVIAQLTAEDILRLLQELPPLYQMVFNLYELEGYSHEEIAGLLDLSTSSSRVYLARAKDQLRKKIQKTFNSEYEGFIRYKTR